jgi:hypothetical protein
VPDISGNHPLDPLAEAAISGIDASVTVAESGFREASKPLREGVASKAAKKGSTLRDKLEKALDFLSDVSTGADDDPVEQAYRLIEEVLGKLGRCETR